MPGKAKICFSVTVSDIASATAAHLHKASAGQDGPIVKGLKAPADGSSSGCVRSSRMMIMEIKKNPSVYYINVHSSAFPDDAIRGQLHN